MAAVISVISFYFFIIVTVLTGWVFNLIDLINFVGPTDGEFVARAIGTVIVPLGAVMGWFF